MPKFQISAESKTGKGDFAPVEVFEAADLMAATPRVFELRKDRNVAFTVTPYVEPATAPAEPVQAPSA